VLVFLTERPPDGGTKGTTVNHVGFGVPNLPAAVNRVKAEGFRIVTREELPPRSEVTDDIGFVPSTGNHVAFVMTPDEAKVELVEDQTMTTAIGLHHIHFASQDVRAMKAWYVRAFNATPGMRGAFEAADFRGLNLSWSPSATPVSGTSGRVLDRIGFELADVENFCRQLGLNGIDLDRPCTKNAASGIATASLTDPWGTKIELTEGLRRIP